MSETFEKGARVAIVSGRQGQGMRGEVFWVGESRYGKGARYGVRGDDGETYWVDGQHVGPEDAVPAPALPEQTALAKGTRVRITRGESAGAEGEVFWVGESKYGRGYRYGVRDDQGETHWIDGPGCEPIEGAPPPPRESAAPSADAREFADDDRATSGFDDAPLPGDDELAYGENDFADDDDPPF